jgi:anti-sigma factor RsiW
VDCNDTRPWLDAFVDGELDLVRRLEVEAHLQTCPACAQTMEKLRANRAALRAALPRYAAPPQLLEKIRAALPPAAMTPTPVAIRPARPAWVWACLGMAASLAAALWLGFVAGVQHGQVNTLVAEAVADHTRSLMAGHLMDVVSTDQHTVKPWFAGKITYAPPVVDLAGDGFPLVGGRLDQLDQRPVAAIVYQRRKHFINLFVWPATPTSLGEQQTHIQGYEICAWSQDGLNFLAVSEISPSELIEFVQKYRQAAQ